MRFLEANESTILSALVQLYPQTGCLSGIPFDMENLVSRALFELHHGTKNWDSNPGYPFQSAYPSLRDLVENEALALVVLAVLLVLRWGQVPLDEARGLDCYQMVERGLSWPIRVFIKMEPHSIEKAKQGRWRLVASVPSQVILAGRILLGPQHRSNIQHVEATAACIGIGLTDTMIDVLYDKATLTADELALVSSDQSGFDWKFYWFWANLLASLWIDRTGATGLWANAIRNYAWSMICSLLVTSDGNVYRLLIQAVRKSGDLDTGAGNSAHRIGLNLAIRLWFKHLRFPHVNKSFFPACTMGDDCFESFSVPVTAELLTGVFANFGFKITDILIANSHCFEFCSTRFEIINGVKIITPLSWPRMLFRLISHDYEPELLQQFCYELRHLTGRKGGITLSDLLLFLQRIGWLQEPGFDPTNTSVIGWRVPHFNMSKATVKKGRGGASKPQRDGELRQAAKSVQRAMPTKGLSFQVKTISDPLTHQDIAIVSYLHTLGNPWVEDPAGVPLIAGTTLIRRTVKAQIKFEVQAIANASGFCFVALNCDGWIGAQVALPTRYASYSGGTQGYPLVTSNASYVGTSFPAAAATSATAGLGFSVLPLLDGQVTDSTNLRMVAAGIRVFSDAAVNTAQGKIAVVATSRPAGTAAQGAVTASSYTTLSTLPTDVISFQSEPAAGWRAGHSLYAVAIPSDPQCFDMFNPPATGAAAFNYPQLAAMLSGGAANQTFTAQVVMDYEFDIGVTNLTGVDTDPIVGASSSDLVPYVAQMHGGKTGKGSANAGLGAQAFLTHTAMTRPSVLPSILKPSSSILSGLGGAAKAALGWAAKSGLAFLKDSFKGIPVVNGAMKLLGL